MLPELGHFSLILALCLSILLTFLPMFGAMTRQPLLMSTARPLAVGQFVFISIAFAFLLVAFLRDDFSVLVVSQTSNSMLPTFYKVAAIWGGHEGSMLLWCLMLAGWTVAVALFSRQLTNDMVARVLSVLGLVSVGFLLFSLLTSNPFERVLPQIPANGQDLNPLLQDFAMAIHPPMLYCGYVGFSVAFAFAIAALTSGRLDAAWARWSRPWTNVAWAFLTSGIALGSWWAYYELGWGGWWFWDPVENASFMPWLVGTALIHSLSVTEKRGVLKSWTVLLAIFAFSLSLLGTFLVRSGVLTSVHSFAADPDRGMFILVLLAIVVGGSLVLYAVRAPTVISKVSFGRFSREQFLLLNNVLFLVASITVLFGTLFPLIMDALELGKYSVGPPYFNTVFVPLMIIVVIAMGFAVVSQWKKTNAAHFKTLLSASAVGSVILGLVFTFVYAGSFKPATVATVSLASWIVLSHLGDLRNKLRHASSLTSGLRKLTPSYYGMLLAHLGMASCVMGTCLVTQFSDQKDLRMVAGDVASMGGYDFRFMGTKSVKGPNFQADEGHIDVLEDGVVVVQLFPQKRQYLVRKDTMTEAAIDAGLFRDLYVALGEPLDANAWSIRIHYKPFVRWIWMGACLMMMGGLLTVADKRYRLRDRRQVEVTPDQQAVKHAATALGATD